VFSDKKPPVIRAVTSVPGLRLASAADRYIRLTDPTLFALPHPGDFVNAVWNQPRVPARPQFSPAEPSGALALDPHALGQSFGRYLATNQFAAWTPDFSPEPRFSQPVPPATWALPTRSAVRLRGELTRRPLVTPLAVPDWPAADIIAPSKVQVLVNPAGEVVSAILLAPDAGYETAPHDDLADQRALEIARAARFAPASRTTLGQIIFTWHTVPVPPAAPAGANPAPRP
jgi:hypothetical protein